MRTKLNGILTLLLAFFVHISFAQDKSISGTVVDQDGLPLPGVNIVVEGTTNGTQTDFDGNYSLQASTGQVLLFTYVGQKDQRATVGASNTINITMQEDAQALDEVIVTALGIKKEKKALGYAVTEVGQESLENRPTGDVARVLQGKTAGIQITDQSGLAGSGTNVIIRGQTSFTGSNQALFIVDGVPFNTSTSNQQASAANGNQASFANGNAGSSRFLDLDPNSIESINVLRGLAAATLYGSQGRNGVILITTKGGSSRQGPKKTEVTVNSSYFVQEIASLPDYQNEFGGGFDQAFGLFFSNWGPAFSRNSVASFENDPNIDDNSTIPHPFATANPATGIPAAFPEFADVRYDFIPYDNVGAFFREGSVASNSFNVRGSSADGNVSYNLNYGHLENKGFTPNNRVTRNSLGIGGSAKLSNKFTVNGTLNYARTNFVTPPVAASLGNGALGNGSSVFGDLFFTPRSIDLIGIPFQNPITGGSVYYRTGNDIQHPLWTVANAEVSQRTNRVFGQAALRYDINDNLNILFRAGIDFASEFNTNSQNRGGVNGDARLQSGVLTTFTTDNTIFDNTFTVNGQYGLSEKLGLNFNVGGTSRRELTESNGITSDNQQAFGVLRHFNFLNTLPIQFTSERNIVGIFAQAELDYDNFIFLTLAARNDWVSNFSRENRNQAYPSASVSFIPTEVIDGIKGNALNYLKVRGGVGTSANFDTPDAFPIANRLNLNVRDFQDGGGQDIVTNTVDNTIGNPDLEPELLTEVEIGIESKWWDNRVGFDLSLFTRTTDNLIVDRPLDASTSGLNTFTNIGEIQNDGIEIDLNVDIFRSKNNGFSWNSAINFSASDPVVTDLGVDTDQVIFSGFANLGNAAIEGEPLGALFGSRIATNDAGEFLVGADGDFVQDPNDGIIGDPNPDFVANFINTFSYKNFTLSMQWNWTQGGDIFSSTIATLLGRGLITETVDRLNTFVLPGVDSQTGLPNTRQINNSDFYFSNVLGGPAELQVFDATTVRLQELSLSYALPSKALDKTPFGGISVSLSGRNLWFDAINTPDGANFDPNVNALGVGNGQGFDFLAGPSARSYGVSVKASF